MSWQSRVTCKHLYSNRKIVSTRILWIGTIWWWCRRFVIAGVICSDILLNYHFASVHSTTCINVSLFTYRFVQSDKAVNIPRVLTVRNLIRQICTLLKESTITEYIYIYIYMYMYVTVYIYIYMLICSRILRDASKCIRFPVATMRLPITHLLSTPSTSRLWRKTYRAENFWIFEMRMVISNVGL